MFVLGPALGLLSLLRLRSRLDPGHHLLLCNEVIDPLKQTQETLHVEAPLVQNVVGIARLGEAHNPRRPVDFGINRLGCHQLADVLLRLVLSQIQQPRQPVHPDPCIVLGHHPYIVLNDPLAQVLPPLESHLVVGLALLGVEDLSVAEVGAEQLRDFGPPHQLVNSEELQQLSILGNRCVPRIFVNSVEKIVLLVVVGRKNDEVDNSLQHLSSLLAPAVI